MTSHIRTETETPVKWQGWAWPSEVEVQWETGEAAYKVVGQMTEEGPKITRIEITGPSLGHSQTREPIVSRWQSGFWYTVNTRMDGPARVLLAPGGRTTDPTAAANRLEEVAVAYRSAPSRKRTRAVADALSVSEGYARRLVMAARAEGLI